MRELIIILSSILLMSNVFDYFMINIGDVMVDVYGSVYRVTDKNWISAVIENDYDKKRVLLISLAIRYKRIDRNFY